MEMQQFYYDNKIVKKIHLRHHSFWGSRNVSGLILAFMFLFPNITDGVSWLSFD
jgi:cytochrome c oxidase cbb3-type subunit I/II